MPTQNDDDDVPGFPTGVVTICNPSTLAEGVRSFGVTFDDRPLVAALPGGGIASLHERRYTVSIECNEAVFLAIFNIAIRGSSNAPDPLAQLVRHVEVPE